MATKKVYDLSVKIGTYEKDGETKGRYQNIGVMLEKDDGGRFIIMESWFNPAGVPHEAGKGIMVSMFEPRQDDGQSRPQSKQGPAAQPARQSPFGDGSKSPASADGFTDDVPF
jgi:hypothetical protein